MLMTERTIHHHSQKREIAYNKEFRGLLREHPGIINTARQLISQGEANYHPANFNIGLYEMGWDEQYKVWEILSYNGEPQKRDGDIPNMPQHGRGTFLRPGDPQRDQKTGLEITVLGISNRAFIGDGWGQTVIPAGIQGFSSDLNRIEQNVYLKAQLGDRSYFVKKGSKTINPGVKEFLNTKAAEAALNELDFVSVAKAQLGYQDANETWYVSNWQELESEGFMPYDIYEVGGVTDSGQNYSRTKDPIFKSIDFNKIEQQKEQIETKLRTHGVNIEDTRMNFYYNYKTGKFFLLDVTTANSEAE